MKTPSVAAVKADDATRQERALFGRQKAREFGNLVGLADRAGRVEVAEVMVAGWVVRKSREKHIGFDCSRLNGIYAHIAAQINGQSAGQDRKSVV